MRFDVPIVRLFSALCLLLYANSLVAVSFVSLDRISFDKVGREEWIRTRLEISSSGNPSDSARDPRFLDGLKLKLHLSFGDTRKGFSFYSSEVEIVTLEQGEKHFVDFFLPGSIVKRDRLNTTPFAYLAEFSVGTHPLPFQSEFGSSNMSSESAREMFVVKASESQTETEGILVPSYYAPIYLRLEDEDRYPAYKRSVPGF